MSGCTIYSSYFPKVDDLKLIIAAGITLVYFFGPINDAEAVQLVNTSRDLAIPLEMVKLENS